MDDGWGFCSFYRRQGCGSKWGSNLSGVTSKMAEELGPTLWPSGQSLPFLQGRSPLHRSAYTESRMDGGRVGVCATKQTPPGKRTGRLQLYVLNNLLFSHKILFLGQWKHGQTGFVFHLFSCWLVGRTGKNRRDWNRQPSKSSGFLGCGEFAEQQ